MATRATRSGSEIAPEQLCFAENIVAKAGILEDETANLLISSFASVPRACFLDLNFRSRALEDECFPVGFGQTSTAPSTVARMLGLLGLRPKMRILEVGAGSGYCSAIMAAAGAHVFGVECVGLLAQSTRKRLDALSYQNVIVKGGDGIRGWAEHAPYDGIIVWAAFEEYRKEIREQLTVPGGRLVAPLGNALGQILTLWEAKATGVATYQLEPSNFPEGKVTTLSAIKRG